MNLLNQIKNSPELKAEWEKLLGAPLINEVLEQPVMTAIWEAVCKDWHTEDKETSEFYNFSEAGTDVVFSMVPKGLFEPVYVRLYRYIHRKLTKIQSWAVDEEIKIQLSHQMAKKMLTDCMRCLIEDLKNKKLAGALCGRDSSEEYRYYIEEYLSDFEYQNRFFRQYPELTQLLICKAGDFVKATETLLDRLEQDREAIKETICSGRAFSRVVSVTAGLSDEHRPGETAVRLTLDNGCGIYYKPHGLETAVYYHAFHGWLLKHMGMDAADYRIVDRSTYGWEEEILYKECQNEAEVREYYYRLGIQLCLAYVLWVSDLHQENMVANGKYPVFIDLEVMGDRHMDLMHGPIYLKDIQKDTVMHTGILPAAGPGGMNPGGMGKNQHVQQAFRMPVVVNAGTSDIGIDYVFTSVKEGKNHPVFNGKPKNFRNYADQVQQGFIEAFKTLIRYKENQVYDLLKTFPAAGRFVMRNTQEYLMYMNLSQFPEMMKNGEKRSLLLMRMALHLPHGLNGTHQGEFLKYELSCIRRMIFPVYTAKDTSLIMGNNIELNHYFSWDRDRLLQRIGQRLTSENMDFQVKVMQTAFFNANAVFKTDGDKNQPLTPAWIARRLMTEYCICEKEQGWMGLYYHTDGMAGLGPVNMSLYNGICGIEIFMAAMAKYGDIKACRTFSRMLTNHLFHYTDLLCGGLKKPEGWGLFTGEMSIVFGYIILYRITGNSDYICYAGKHSTYIAAHLDEISGYDLLDGQAGVMLGFLMMYEICGDPSYLQASRKLMQMLEKGAVSLFPGIGWLCSGQTRPLAGMAHGNSGIAMAVARLYKNTGDLACKKLVEAALLYEDSLYDCQQANWADLRSTNREGTHTLAWCHGAPGILIARKHIEADTGIKSQIWESKEIYDKIKHTVKPDQCLCHGNTGLWMMLDYLGQTQYNRNILSVGALSLEDRLSPGFMTGLSGIGYALMREENRKLPDVIGFL